MNTDSVLHGPSRQRRVVKSPFRGSLSLQKEEGFQPMPMEEMGPQIQIQHNLTKRLFDLLFAATVLFAGAPIFFTIALSILLTSKGPIFYRQERVGRGAVPFYCYKFRSMFKDADRRLHALLARDPKLLKEWKATFKLKNDPRITPVGKFLRRTSLDELPQFWNVLRGDLSVVGPRPVVKQEVEEYLGSRALKILSIKPGLTCFWQVSGRNNMSYSERLQLDERYVNERNFWLDLKLIVKTIPAMFSSKGAY